MAAVERSDLSCWHTERPKTPEDGFGSAAEPLRCALRMSYCVWSAALLRIGDTSIITVLLHTPERD